MPSLFAASMTVLPWGTSTALPSISMFSIECSCPRIAQPSDVGRNDALPVPDVVLEFAAKMLDEALHRQRRRVAQRADRPAGDVVGDRGQHVEVLRATLAVLDPVDHPPHPARSFAAGRALPAGFLVVEIGQAQQAPDHAAR